MEVDEDDKLVSLFSEPSLPLILFSELGKKMEIRLGTWEHMLSHLEKTFSKCLKISKKN
jgi:hypothetical protein